jgi:DNA helicase-2/ATP-dependent DNA helicase PcrA
MADDAAGFEPKPGHVTISTMHSAKGLEWDRVHLLGVNSYSFPDGSERCSYMAEKFWVRERLNLGAELERQIKQLQQGPASLDDYQEGAATASARVALAGERLRLLYVGITRARRELIITWNTGRGKEPARPALAFAALGG